MGRTLAARILAAVLGIVVLTMAIGAGLYAVVTGDLTDRQAEQQARSIAMAVAAMPEVTDAVTGKDVNHTMPALAERIRSGSGASYVVVIDRNGLRYSHPNPALIGQRVEEPVVAVDGQVHVGIDEGSLGRSANVKAPVRDPAGAVVGEVSVGILETEIGDRFAREMLVVVLYSAVALALGVLASLVLARAIKRVTFGLEPAEIVQLVQEREAMLHGIREGVVGLDDHGRINVINDEARRLLNLAGLQPGQLVEDVLPAGQVRDVLSGRVTGPDRIAVTDDHLLVLNRMPVRVGERMAGWVVTIRDRTEMEGLLRQLDSVSGLTAALRAQEHEFANRLHVLSTLLELGETDEATRYSQELRTHTVLVAERIRERIASPVVAALLLSKTTLAAERDVVLVVEPASRLSAADVDPMPLVTVVGNLVDNAVDAVSESPASEGISPRGTVTVLVQHAAQEILIRVTDTGPGIPRDRLEDVFVDGYSTKTPRPGMHRGVGLALVHRLVARAGGTIEVSGQGGATFTVLLPVPAAARPPDGPFDASLPEAHAAGQGVR